MGYWFGSEENNQFLISKDTLLDHVQTSFVLRNKFINKYDTDPRQIEWNMSYVTSWMSAAHHLLSLLTILLHVTSSCGPPRGEEYSNYSLVNTGYALIACVLVYMIHIIFSVLGLNGEQCSLWIIELLSTRTIQRHRHL